MEKSTATNLKRERESPKLTCNGSYEEAIWVPVRGRDSLTSKIAASLGCDEDREGWETYQ